MEMHSSVSPSSSQLAISGGCKEKKRGGWVILIKAWTPALPRSMLEYEESSWLTFHRNGALTWPAPTLTATSLLLVLCPQQISLASSALDAPLIMVPSSEKTLINNKTTASHKSLMWNKWIIKRFSECVGIQKTKTNCGIDTRLTLSKQHLRNAQWKHLRRFWNAEEIRV